MRNPYKYILNEDYHKGELTEAKATDIVGYSWGADEHSVKDTLAAIKKGTLKVTKPSARKDQHGIPDEGVKDREGNEIHPIFRSDRRVESVEEALVSRKWGNTKEFYPPEKDVDAVNIMSTRLLVREPNHPLSKPFELLRRSLGRNPQGKFDPDMAIRALYMNGGELQHHVPPSILLWALKRSHLEAFEDGQDELTEAATVDFYWVRTKPHKGLPDERIITCIRGDKQIAEIWPERGMNNKVDGYTVHPPAEYDERGRIRVIPTNPPAFKEKLFMVPSGGATPAACLAAAKKFVKSLP